MRVVRRMWPDYLYPEPMLSTYIAPTEYLPLVRAGPPHLLEMCAPVCPVPMWPANPWTCPQCGKEWKP